jgi:hypothetical protein
VALRLQAKRRSLYANETRSGELLNPGNTSFVNLIVAVSA